MSKYGYDQPFLKKGWSYPYLDTPVLQHYNLKVVTIIIGIHDVGTSKV